MQMDHLLTRIISKSDNELNELYNLPKLDYSSVISQWTPGISYTPGTLVYLDNTIYRCLSLNVNVIPYSGEFSSLLLKPGLIINTSQWELY